MDVPPIAASAFLSARPQFPRQLPALDQNVGLLLNAPLRFVSEPDARVLDDFRHNAALGIAACVQLSVPICIGASVSVHGGVAHIFPDDAGNLVALKQLVKVPVDHVADSLRVFPVRGVAHRGCLHFDVFRRDAGYREQHAALDEVKDRRRKSV